MIVDDTIINLSQIKVSEFFRSRVNGRVYMRIRMPPGASASRQTYIFGVNSDGWLVQLRSTTGVYRSSQDRFFAGTKCNPIFRLNTAE